MNIICLSEEINHKISEEEISQVNEEVAPLTETEVAEATAE